mgnify:CR=1 FL=1
MSGDELIKEVERLSSLLKSAESDDELKRIVQELHADQMNLEVENRELRKKQIELEEDKKICREIYDFAPSGYCTIDAGGIIKDINLTGASILGKERPSLINLSFMEFIAEPDRDKFSTYLKECSDAQEKRKIELTINEQNKPSAYVELLTVSAADKGQNIIYRIIFTDITERKKIEEAQLFLLHCGYRSPEEDFFKLLAQYLAKTLDMDFVCIDSLEGDNLSARTLAVYFDGKFEDNIVYTLKDTPCGEVVGKVVCSFPKDVRHMFPEDAVLQKMKAESYAGVTLWSSDGKPIGLIAVMGRRKTGDLKVAETILKLVSLRAAGELEYNQIVDSLRKSEQRLVMAQKSAGAGVWDWDMKTGLLEWSRELFYLFGLKPDTDKATFDTWRHVIYPDDIDIASERIDRAIKDGTLLNSEYRIVLPDGEIRWINALGRTIYDQSGRPERMAGICIDITEQKLADELILSERNKLKSILDSYPYGIYIVNQQYDIEYINPVIEQEFGLILNRKCFEYFHNLKEPCPWCKNGEVFSGKTVRWEWTSRHGRVYDLFDMPILNSYGKLSKLEVFYDITERKRAEEARRKSEEKLMFAMETSHIGMWDLDLVNHSAFRSLEHDRIFGYKELLPEWTYEMFLEHVLPEERLMVDSRFKHAIETVSDWNFECPIRRTDGELRWIWAAGRHQIDDASGSRHMAGIVQDITDRKKAEEDREKLQNQLLHSQKMESVGRLAGGVAHDFNNILGIIISVSELILMDMEADDPLYTRLQQIINSSERAANLVGQLLAFARKQTVSPRILDINETISSMIKMLHRIIGEDIELIWMPGYNLEKVRIDPTQIDQILVNLVINSRDAIPGIGSITLETANVIFDTPSVSGYEVIPPGEYVMLSVSDTGAGISKELMKNIFEPFFTTKELGKGTGLGLATVYGIVRQNNGFINVYSEEGKGTTFKIYLPCIKSKDIHLSSGKTADRPERGTETILITEDEEDYLMPCKMLLEKLGYTVLAARTPGEAITISEQYRGKINLLIVDVVMPEMNGRELMEKIHTIRPELKCLYMSGYTANIIAHHGVLDEGVNFIEKPFSIKIIAKKVREILDEK